MQGEFFSTDSIETVADSLVREFVQNSMDAGSGDGVVHIRFHVGECADHDVLDAVFGELWPHLAACDPKVGQLRNSPCRYLTAEDFNTTGLRGDPGQMYETEGAESNEFYYFFRAEGKSSKKTSSRGSWGIGKYTFPMASNLNTFIGLTRREDNHQPGGAGPLVIGQAILDHHLLNGTHYNPDGWWCNSVTSGEDALPLPFGLPRHDDKFNSENFVSAFGIRRRDEAGLSVVVPYVDSEMTAEAVLVSVLKNYGLSIKLGQITVEIDGDGPSQYLTKETVFDAVSGLSGDRQEQVRGEIDLASWYLSEGRDARITLVRGAASTKWDERVTDEEADRIRSKLDNGDRVTVRVPMPVGGRSGASEDSWFDVLLQPIEGYSGSANFYREGLRISEVKSPRLHGVKALVLVTDRPLASMLGAAETPAHVDWQAGTARFKGRFKDGRNWVSFVKRAPSSLVQALRSGGADEDLDVAAGFFSVPIKEGIQGKRSTGPGQVTPPSPPPPPSQSRLRIVSTASGFSIRPGRGLQKGDMFKVVAAYDVRRGDPFRRWVGEDFLFPDLDCNIDGAEVCGIEDNWAEFIVEDPEKLDLQVDGFDPRRDLVVRARVHEDVQP